MNILLSLLFACTSNPDSPADDTAVTDDTAATDDTGGASVQCLADHGVLSASTTWRYDYSSGELRGQRVVTVTAYDADANTFSTQTEDTRSSSEVSYQRSVDDDYRCDETGLHLLRSEGSYASTTAGVTSEGDFVKTYDAPALLRPNHPVLGDTWSGSFAGSADGSNGPSTFDYVVSSEVVDDSKVIGDGFRSISIETSDGSYHWQHGVGVTGDDYNKLQSHTP